MREWAAEDRVHVSTGLTWFTEDKRKCEVSGSEIRGS